MNFGARWHNAAMMYEAPSPSTSSNSKAVKRSYDSFLCGYVMCGGEGRPPAEKISKKGKGETVGAGLYSRMSPTTVVSSLSAPNGAYNSSEDLAAQAYGHPQHQHQHQQHVSPPHHTTNTVTGTRSHARSPWEISAVGASSLARRCVSLDSTPQRALNNSSNNMSPGTAMSSCIEQRAFAQAADGHPNTPASTGACLSPASLTAHYTSSRRMEDYFSTSTGRGSSRGREHSRQLQGHRLCRCPPGSYCECAGVAMDDGGGDGGGGGGGSSSSSLSLSPPRVASYGRVMELTHLQSMNVNTNMKMAVAMPMATRKCLSCSASRATAMGDEWAVCHFCSKDVCADCVATCERCRDTFCPVCTTQNYSGMYAATMCLDCNTSA
jgi:hypothetical protein